MSRRDSNDNSSLGVVLADSTRTHLFAMFAELADRMASVSSGESGFGQLPVTGPADSRLSVLSEVLDLSSAEVALLACAVAPALDHRFASLFADSDSSPARPCPRVDVALEICGLSMWEPAHRAALRPDGTLSRACLWTITGTGPLPTRTIEVDERVVAHLLGDDAIGDELLVAAVAVAAIDVPEVDKVARLIESDAAIVWIRDPSGHTGASVAATALATLGLDPVVVDLGHRTVTASAVLVDIAIREAVLTRGGVVVTGVEIERDAVTVSGLGRQPCPLVVTSTDAWDPSKFSIVAAQIEVQAIDEGVRRDVWASVLERSGIDAAAEELLDLATLRIGPGQIAVAAATGAAGAIAAGAVATPAHLRTGALAHGAGRLERLATRIEPRASFDDLVLPAMLLADLQSIPGWMRTRHQVRIEWGMDRGARNARGIACLFAGPSGTGKTLAAEVVAHSLGVDLFVIDLSQIVDKYIGETEKNLERVFTEAEGINGVLLFDEADALFGKRSDVKSSHDRHANVEVAYLLQRMERYDGIAVLTTNLRNNLDEAFTRRLDVILSFPEPGVADRRALWQRHLPPTVPIDADVDLDALAEHLAVTGGIIRNVTMAAAHAAAIDGKHVSMGHLVTAAEREYRKIGRLFAVAPFRRWLPTHAIDAVGVNGGG